MGVEYDLISDVTREGYELGKGPWAWLVPQFLRASPNPIAAITRLLVDDQFEPAYAAEVAREVVAFINAHPDWRIIDDCSSDITVMTDEERARTLSEELAEGLGDGVEEGFPIYRKVGSRYRK